MKINNISFGVTNKRSFKIKKRYEASNKFWHEDE